MNLTPDAQKKAAAVGGFVLLAGGILYYQLRDDTPARTAAPPVITQAPVQTASVARTGSAAKAAVTTSAAQLDPSLRMDSMLETEKLVYAGTGRNIFSAESAPAALPAPVASARPKTPPPPAYMPPVGPPPPPPIDLKFFGTATSGNGKRQAFLLHGQDVFLASDGDIVQRRYRVILVQANSILVEDMTNNNRQMLPLIAH